MDRPSFHYRPRDGVPLDPIVSIVTPAFNCGEIFLETALSVLRQSFQHWEWIIVDDASDDSTSRAVLSDFSAADERVRLLESPTRQGPSAVRNAGVAAARGQLIYLLDSDDLIEPTTLEKYIWTLYSFPELGFVSSYQVGFGVNRYLYPYGFQEPERFLKENGTDVMALIRKSVFDATGGFDATNTRGLEDWEFWIRAAEQGFWGHTVPEYLEWYRWKGDNSRWTNWDGGTNQHFFREMLQSRYPRTFSGAFPPVNLDFSFGQSFVRTSVGFANPLEKVSKRVLLIFDTMSEQENRPVEIVGRIESGAMEATVVLLSSESPELEARCTTWTPDFFVLDRFIPSSRYLQFLKYLCESRQYDSIVLVSQKLGYAAGLLTRECGAPVVTAEPNESAPSIWARALESI